MTATDAQVRPGPVDYLVIEFPPDRQEFTGETVGHQQWWRPIIIEPQEVLEFIFAVEVSHSPAQMPE